MEVNFSTHLIVVCDLGTFRLRIRIELIINLSEMDECVKVDPSKAVKENELQKMSYMEAGFQEARKSSKGQDADQRIEES